MMTGHDGRTQHNSPDTISWVGEIGSRAPPGQLNSEIIFSTPRIST